MQAAHIVPKEKYGSVDLFGPTVESYRYLFIAVLMTKAFSCCPGPCWRYHSSRIALNGLT